MNWWYTGWYLWGNDSYYEYSFFTLWAENVKHVVGGGESRVHFVSRFFFSETTHKCYWKQIL